MGNAAVHALLSHLAVDLQMSPSTQNQALARELRELTVHNGKGGQDRLEVGAPAAAKDLAAGWGRVLMP